ncbi:MAG: hypothetical protein Q8922_00970 [Bacteroidota bacterium]|nr:hypothetical protein [Bacteroidota bacterium]MDP4232605.1 hypothetical protein [Bacteroidota bacterium]MDP4242941.1 hypothetical protein [Bacteroidota bacterium]MDP4286484.1 hypothetical protein [Bacteroidota bacterium]
MDNELLISKHLSGDLTSDEAQAFNTAGHDPSFSENLGWDRAVHETLTRDAAAFPAFASLPNTTLLSKLATQTPAKSVSGLLWTKFALLAGGAALLGTAAYLIPNAIQRPSATQRSNAPAVSIPRPTDTPIAPVVIVAKPAQPPPISPTTAQPRQTVKTNRPPIRLNDEDDKNPQTITDPNYKPPVR